VPVIPIPLALWCRLRGHRASDTPASPASGFSENDCPALRLHPPSAPSEQPDIALRLHASIRRQLKKKGATDASFIASEALKALDEK
jgi:hypothetical protein